MNLQVETDHYFNAGYDSRERFISYWHQINEIITLTPSSIFEIGIGSGQPTSARKGKWLATSLTSRPTATPCIGTSRAVCGISTI